MSNAYPLLTPEAVDRIFVNLQGCLPKYVPVTDSRKLGLRITFLTIFSIIVLAIYDRVYIADTNKLIDSIRWLIVIFIGIFASIYVGSVAEHLHYNRLSIRENHQHFANLHWLKLYGEVYRNIIHPKLVPQVS